MALLSIVSAMFITITTIGLLLRLYTRKFILNLLWVDDYLAIVAWVIFFLYPGMETLHRLTCLYRPVYWPCRLQTLLSSIKALRMAIIPCQYRWAQEDNGQSAIALQCSFRPLQKMLYAGNILTTGGQLFTKLTFFFQFYRIVRNTGSPLRVHYICIITLISCWLVAQIIVTSLPCIPVAAFWDTTIEGYCPDSTPSRWMSSIGNIVTDFIILLLPVPVIWRLRIARGQKLALGAVFGLGFL